MKEYTRKTETVMAIQYKHEADILKFARKLWRLTRQPVAIKMEIHGVHMAGPIVITSKGVDLKIDHGDWLVIDQDSNAYKLCPWEFNRSIESPIVCSNPPETEEDTPSSQKNRGDKIELDKLGFIGFFCDHNKTPAAEDFYEVLHENFPEDWEAEALCAFYWRSPNGKKTFHWREGRYTVIPPTS